MELNEDNKVSPTGPSDADSQLQVPTHSLAPLVAAVIYFVGWMPVHVIVWGLYDRVLHGRSIHQNTLSSLHAFNVIATFSNTAIAIWIIVCVRLKL